MPKNPNSVKIHLFNVLKNQNRMTSNYLVCDFERENQALSEAFGIYAERKQVRKFRRGPIV